MTFCKWCKWIRNKKNNSFHPRCKGNNCECVCRSHTVRPPYPEHHVLPYNLKLKTLN